jgi:hypothetical protein
MCRGRVVDAILVVFELSAINVSEAGRPLAEDGRGRAADEGIGSPPEMEARRAKALTAPWSATSQGAVGLMRDEREYLQTYGVRRAGMGRLPRS